MTDRWPPFSTAPSQLRLCPSRRTVRCIAGLAEIVYVEQEAPLGLAHMMGTSHHYGPAPWVHDLARPEWNPVYYHKADATGIGFDRTSTGSNAVAQYARPVAALFADPKTTPERNLLADYYRADVARLAKVVDFDISHWLAASSANIRIAGTRDLTPRQEPVGT